MPTPPGLTPSRELLHRCCASGAWVDLMTSAAPYADLEDLVDSGRRAWTGLRADDWREALAAHPRIGDRPPAGSTEAGEQAGADDADPAVRAALADGNAAYERRFGTTYVVRASGRTAEQMLALLRDRLAAEPTDELVTAADEQWEITELRLRAAYC